jgi:peptidoglycan/LPS O-acetylase OafA/YrhL
VRRLYPPYLVALCLSLALTAATIGIPLTRFVAWDVASHLLMLHNFDTRTCYSISSVFWTLAVEEQLYLAYFLLLFLRRRWGWAATLWCCLAARVAWFAAGELLRAKAGVEVPVTESAAVHWFTWALGALAVEAAFGVVTLPRWTRDLRVAAAALLAAAALAYVQDTRAVSRPLHDATWLLLHPAWGFGFFVLLNRAVAAEWGRALRPSLPRIVAGLAAVGVVSYSLYLTHPLVLLFAWRFEALPLPPLVVRLFVLTPLCLAFAWLFFRLFERPFLTRRAAPAQRAAAAATTALPAEV